MSLHSHAFFFTYPVEPTGYVVHSKYCGKREHQCGDDVVYIKTETKPFTQNANVSHFLEGHLSPLHSRLAKESRIFRKRFKIIVSSTLKKTCLKTLWRDGSLPIPLHLVFLNEKTLLFVIGFPCFVLNSVYTWCFFVSNCLSNVINNYIWLNIILMMIVVLFYALNNRGLVIFSSMRPLVASGEKPKAFFFFPLTEIMPSKFEYNSNCDNRRYKIRI